MSGTTEAFVRARELIDELAAIIKTASETIKELRVENRALRNHVRRLEGRVYEFEQQKEIT